MSINTVQIMNPQQREMDCQSRIEAMILHEEERLEKEILEEERQQDVRLLEKKS